MSETRQEENVMLELPDLDRLERLAKYATPGPWKVELPDCSIEIHSEDGDIVIGATSFEDDMEFIAACDPTTVLALLRRIRELENAVTEIQAIASESTGVAGWHLNGEVATWDELNLAALYEPVVEAEEETR